MCVGPADSGQHVVERKAGDAAGDQPPDDVLRLDPATRTLSWRGRSVRLTPAQASVMILLMRAAPEPVSREAIWSIVEGCVPARRTSAMRILIHKLRRTCRESLGQELVETVRGKGYRLRSRARIDVLGSVSEK